MEEPWITVEESVSISGYHTEHIRRLLRTGHLDGRKWGQAWQVSRSALMDYLDKVANQGERRGPKKVTPLVDKPE